ncbi:MAG: FtsX-like permease family protein [Bacteroidota bacterium]|nr:FtsX-like permease family protein [Bacteroidota bacterium]
MVNSVSWKNIWRNKLRSAVILVAMALGLTAGVFLLAFYYGMVKQRIAAAIDTESSHIQVHQADYLENNEIANFIPGADHKLGSIKEMEHVKAVSRRLVINSMISSAETGSGVRIMGVEPEKEKQVTNLYTKIKDGAYFEGVKRNPIVIGHKLAEKLKVRVRSKVVLTSQELDGTLTGGSFRVAGIYRTSNSVYDESTAFVRLTDLANLVKMDASSAHEIAVYIDDNEHLAPTAEKISGLFPQSDVKSWETLMPEVAIIKESMNLMMYITIIIILLAMGFSIVNTMLMSVLERVKELGMLMAIGMNRLRIFMMIVLETVYLSLVGGMLGLFLGILISNYFGKTGIDLSIWGEGLEAYGYDIVIFPILEVKNVVIVSLLIIATGIVSALYPAYKALKLNPAEALRIDN